MDCISKHLHLERGLLADRRHVLPAFLLRDDRPAERLRDDPNVAGRFADPQWDHLLYQCPYTSGVPVIGCGALYPHTPETPH